MEEPTRNGVDEPSGFRHGRGTNQSGMRAFNERLVLSLVRRHGSLAKTEIARMTGLSAQTVSVIMRGLEADRLLVRGAPQRGKVGQPSIPMALNPDGAFFFGLKLGRRSADLVLIDFLGTVRCMLHDTYPYPVPESTTRFVVEGVKEALSRLDKAQAERVAGLGIAMPFELWNWADAAGAPAGAMEAWRHVDMRAEVAARCPFPVYLQNDATAACGAELVFGTAPPKGDFLYLYVGAFIGGGVVIDGRLQTGPTGNAGAIGSMPVPDGKGGNVQLIDVASIAVLERAMKAKGRDASRLWTSPEDWGDIGPLLESWMENAAEGISHAIVSACAVYDFESVVVEGWLPSDVRTRLVDAVRERLGERDTEGLRLPVVREGTVGRHARALGGASLALAERFLVGNR